MGERECCVLLLFSGWGPECTGNASLQGAKLGLVAVSLAAAANHAGGQESQRTACLRAGLPTWDGTAGTQGLAVFRRSNPLILIGRGCGHPGACLTLTCPAVLTGTFPLFDVFLVLMARAWAWGEAPLSWMDDTQGNIRYYPSSSSSSAARALPPQQLPACQLTIYHHSCSCFDRLRPT